MKLKSQKKLLPYFLVAFCLLVVAGAVMAYFAVVGCYESEAGFFVSDSTLVSALYLLVILSAILGGVYIFTENKETLSEEIETSVFTKISAVILGVSIIAGTVNQIKYYNSTEIVPKIASYMFVAMMVLALPTVAYYLFTVFTKNNKLLGFMSFFPVLWSSCYLLQTYFDASENYNSPIRILAQLSIISLMLYTAFESRFHIKKPAAVVYYGISLFAAVILCISAVVQITIKFTVAPLGNVIVFLEITKIVYIIYILSRVISGLKRRKIEE